MFMFNSTSYLSDILVLTAFGVGAAIGWIYFDAIRDKIIEIYNKYKKR